MLDAVSVVRTARNANRIIPLMVVCEIQTLFRVLVDRSTLASFVLTSPHKKRLLRFELAAYLLSVCSLQRLLHNGSVSMKTVCKTCANSV